MSANKPDVGKPTVLYPIKGSSDVGHPIDQAYVSHLINSIFSPGSVRSFLHQQFAPDDVAYESFSEFMGKLRGFFAQNLSTAMASSAMGDMDQDILKQAERLAEFEREFAVDSQRYTIHSKPNPEAVFWPNPSNKNHAASLFDIWPMIENLGLVDKTTPIGSAGSCFASEIAYYLQDNGYNYVVTEADEKDGPQPESSARWGIIFNTPSFKQLAEKAFGERTMPNMVEYHPAGNYWQDPFRENIPYLSIEDLEADRERHILACRKALETCKVFFITLGLNECWEFRPDGAVASRSPKSLLHYALFRHRVLTVEENVANLQRFLDILRRHNPDVQLIVTVSPVPFMATGLGETKHVVVANAHSKAILRVAAEEFVAANEGVYYFPSFEMVMHCLEDPWEADQRHIKRDAVGRIMKLFEKTFVPQDETPADDDIRHMKFVSDGGRLALHDDSRAHMNTISPWLRHAIYHQACQQAYAGPAASASAAPNGLSANGYAVETAALSEAETSKISEEMTNVLEGLGPNSGAHGPVSDDPILVNVDVPQKGALRDALRDALPRILNARVSNVLETYFSSHFRIFSAVTYRTHALEDHVASFRWHRDMAPMAQVHIMAYLTPSGADGGNTLILDLKSTEKAAHRAYHYEHLDQRTTDLAQIFGGAEAAPEPFSPELAAGDLLLFAAPRVLHRGSLPKQGYRDTFTLVLLPSSVPWQRDIEDFGDDHIFAPGHHTTLSTDPFLPLSPKIPDVTDKLTTVNEDWVLSGKLLP